MSENSLASEPSRSEWRGIVLRGSIAVLVLVGVYIAGAYYLGQRVPNGTSVEGVAIGNLTPEDAQATLERRLESERVKPIAVTTEFGEISLESQEAGLDLDLDDTLQGVAGVSWNPADLWRQFQDEGEELPLQVDVDRTELEAALSAKAEEFDTEPEEGNVALQQGEVQVQDSVPGHVLDVVATGDRIEAAWPQQHEVEGAVENVKPTLTNAEIKRFVDNKAKPALNGPITVSAADDETVVSANQLSRVLSVGNNEGALSLKLNKESLVEVVIGGLTEAERAPQDASVALEGSEVQITQARAGREIDQDSIVPKVRKAINGGNRKIELETTKVEADISEEDAKSWDFSEMSEFRSEFPTGPSNANRTENIRIGLGWVNGTVVMPGDQFSLANTLSPISSERGYVEAGVISNGRLVQGMGGGLSQVSTTVLNAAWFAGVQLDAFTPHSYYISRYPAGREATISVGAIDNVWTNDTDTPIVIQTFISGNEIVMRFIGDRKYNVDTITGERTDYVTPPTRTDDSEDCLPQGAQPGFTITVTRVLSQGGEEQDRQSYTTSYEASPEVRCTGR